MAVGYVFCDFSMLITLEEMHEVSFPWLAWMDFRLMLSSEPQIWKIHPFSWQITSSKEHATYVAWLFFVFQTITSLICDIVVAIAVIASNVPPKNLRPGHYTIFSYYILYISNLFLTTTNLQRTCFETYLR